MTKSIFLLGVTGYIGGSILHELYRAHSDLNYTVIVRGEDKGKKVAEQYKNINVVYGDLDSDDVISKEAEKADIVIAAANCDHLNHIKSIYSGFAKRSTPAFLLHISGSGILVDKSSVSPGLGSQSKISDKDYDDIADIKTITSWPDHFMHRTIDREVLENAPKNVKQLIVCPPCIYGRGTGPLNQTSMQVPGYITAILKRGKGFILQEGKNVWSAIHVVDLAKLMCLLTEEAMKPNGGSATWGSEAYYFASSEKIVWGELAKDITKRLYRKGAVKSEELEVIEKSELGEIDKMTLDLCGSNSKSTASRGKRDVGWAPKQAGVVDSLDEAIQMVLIKDN